MDTPKSEECGWQVWNVPSVFRITRLMSETKASELESPLLADQASSREPSLDKEPDADAASLSDETGRPELAVCSAFAIRSLAVDRDAAAAETGVQGEKPVLLEA